MFAWSLGWQVLLRASYMLMEILIVLCQEQEYCRDIFVVTKEVCDG
jgi:hypothetical protein